jgi:BirA family biotin operon repressor/biotin-[acetyl-CoA-carboxylase] ligase
MHIIKLNAIDSTNAYLKSISVKKVLDDYTVVVTKHQTSGRGQMGTVWNSEKGKNLTFSVYTKHLSIAIEEQFYISMIASLALVKTLQMFNIPRLQVKWPNDILSEQKKICGILIENVIKNSSIEGTIIGVGLNVNQTYFENLPQASSLKNLTGTVFDLDELLVHIVNNLKLYFEQLNKGKRQSIKRAYEALLFRKNKPSTFRDTSGQVFGGFIQGINTNGNLVVLLEDEVIKEFELKEIQLLY